MAEALGPRRDPAMLAACAPPAAVLAWLNTPQARADVPHGLLLTMRWLVLEELERLGPGTQPQPPAHS